MSKTPPPAAPPPPPVDISSPMEDFLDAHFKKLVLAFAVIALGAVIFGIFRYSSRANAVAAGEAFAAAKTVEDCDNVVSEYPGTLSAGNALLLKAELLWTQDKKDASAAALGEFILKYGSHPLMPEALLGRATKLESLGNKAEAQALFQRIISEYSSSNVAALAQIRLGDVFWSDGKEDEAKAAYEAVPTKFVDADPAFLEQSENRLKWISAKLPTKEVDGPPKPKEEKPAATIPGAPQIKLNSPTLSPTLIPGGETPEIKITPAPAAAPEAPAAPMVESKPVEPTPAPVPTPVAPVAPAAPAVVPAPAPAPMPAPAAPAPPAQEAPVPPPVDVKPAPPAPVPVPPPAPAPVPAPADPAPPAPAPEAPAKAAS